MDGKCQHMSASLPFIPPCSFICELVFRQLGFIQGRPSKLELTGNELIAGAIAAEIDAFQNPRKGK